MLSGLGDSTSLPTSNQVGSMAGVSEGQTDSAPRPPSFTNRGVAKFQGGEDTIELALYILWDDTWKETQALLEECKSDAADNESEEGGFFDLGDWTCEVMPNGAKSGANGPYRAYVIRAVGMRFEFTRASEPSGNSPNGKLVVGSLTCMQLGAQGVLDLCREYIEAMGGKLIGNKVSRIDGAVDLPGVRVTDFIEPFQQHRKLCRASKGSIDFEGSQNQSLRLGKDPMIRIYDKKTELFDGTDVDKISFIVQHRWGGEVPDHATRVEFQLRRDTIKSMQFGEGAVVDSLEDYIRCREGVWRYMCNWFRLTVDVVDPNHRDRAVTSPLWQEVTDAFAAWAGSEAKSVTRAKHIRSIDIRALGQQVTGCVVSVCAAVGESCEIADIEREAYQLVRETLERNGSRDVQKRFLKKRRHILAGQVPERDRRPNTVPRRYPFELWLADRRAYERAVVEAGGQLQMRWPGEDLQFLDHRTMVGD